MNTSESNPSDPVDLYYQAQRLRDGGDLDSALQCYSECLELLHRTKDILGQMRILMEMEELFETRGQHARAMTCLKTCLAFAEDVGHEYEKSVVLHRMGHVFYQTEEYERALGRFQDSMQISRTLGDQRGYGLSRAMLGKIQFSMGEVYEGMGLMVEGLSTLHRLKASEQDQLKDQIREYSTKIPRQIYEYIVRMKTDDAEVLSLLLS